MNIVVINHLTLDGVMQAPGRPEEDTRDGFQYGGWATAYNDAVMGQAWGARLSHSGGLLLGRRTYDDVLSYWNTLPDSPFMDALNHAPKYVVSTTLTEPLPWPNSTLLKGNIADDIADLRGLPGRDLHIMGSGALIHTLMRHDLIDEYVLTIHPLVLGSGRRLFPDSGTFTSLRIIDSTTTTTGVVIVTYRPANRYAEVAPARENGLRVFG
jgi:dihydrofolate reductase